MADADVYVEQSMKKKKKKRIYFKIESVTKQREMTVIIFNITSKPVF